MLAGPTQKLSLRAGPARRSSLATLRTPTPAPATTRTPPTTSTSGRTLTSLSLRTPRLSNHCQDQPPGLVITSTPAGRFVYWLDRKPTDLTDGNSRYVAYLDSLPFQEGTPLAPTEDHTPTEVASTDSSLGTPDRQVFMASGETPGPSGTRPDRYFEDISADELPMHPLMKPMTIRVPDVSATRSAMNGADVSENPSLYGILQRPSIKSPTGCTLPPNSASCLSLR
jgi:hypothetical protein